MSIHSIACKTLAMLLIFQVIYFPCNIFQVIIHVNYFPCRYSLAHRVLQVVRAPPGGHQIGQRGDGGAVRDSQLERERQNWRERLTACTIQRRKLGEGRGSSCPPPLQGNGLIFRKIVVFQK